MAAKCWQLNSLNAHNFPIFEPILITLVSTLMVHRVRPDKTYLSLGLLSPLTCMIPVLGPMGFGELRSTDTYYFRGAGKQAHSFVDFWSPVQK